MSLVADLLEVVLKSLTDRLALASLFLALLFLLFAKLIPDTALGGWANRHLVWVYGIGLFSLCYLPTRHILEAIEGWHTNRKQCARFSDLPRDEKQILRQFMELNEKTAWFDQQDAAAKGLAEEGILYCLEVPRRQNGTIAYNMRDWARRYLKRNLRLLQEIPAKSSPSVQR